MIPRDALHCGVQLALGAMKWLSGSLQVAEIWETSRTRKGNTGHDDHTALDIAREKGETGVVSLLERFMTNPTQTRHELRVKLGVLDELAAEVFALIVFLCDDLLQLKPARDTATPSSVKFFTVVSKLPMILCHRAVDSMKQNILHKDSEAAFKSLARTLLRPS